MDEPLRLSTIFREQTVTVVVAGELDIATTGRLRAYAEETLASGRWAVLVLDLSALSFIGATGLGTLVGIQKIARAQDVVLHLAGAGQCFVRVMKAARLDGCFTLRDG